MRGRPGEAGAQRRFPARGGQPEQDGGGDAGAGGQVPVAGELGDEAGEVLGAGVVLEEEVGGDGGVAGELLAPAAVPVGAGQVAPDRGAAAFGPPAGQGGLAAAGAGGGGQGGEEAVGAGGVGELGGQGDGQGAVAAVAELRRW